MKVSSAPAKHRFPLYATNVLAPYGYKNYFILNWDREERFLREHVPELYDVYKTLERLGIDPEIPDYSWSNEAIAFWNNYAPNDDDGRGTTPALEAIRKYREATSGQPDD